MKEWKRRAMRMKGLEARTCKQWSGAMAKDVAALNVCDKSVLLHGCRRQQCKQILILILH